MTKENDQTQDNQEETGTAAATEEKDEQQVADEKQAAEDAKATETAVKTSEDFDKKIDEEGVEETPSSEDSSEEKPAAKKKSPKKKEPESEEKTAEETEEKGDEKVDDKEEIVVSDDVRKRAADAGLTDEEISEFSSDEELTKTLDVIDNIIADDEAQEQVSEQAPAKKPAEKESKDEGFKLKFMDESEVDPEILSNMKAMKDHYETEVKGLREQVKSLTDGIQQQETERFFNRFDEKIEALGIGFADVFGKGPAESISKRSIAGKNRANVTARMYALGKAFSETNQKIPDEQVLFDMAVNSLFPKKVKTAEGLKMQQKTKKRARGAIGRTAARRTGDLTPTQKAIETSKKFDDLIDTSED